MNLAHTERVIPELIIVTDYYCKFLNNRTFLLWLFVLKREGEWVGEGEGDVPATAVRNAVARNRTSTDRLSRPHMAL